MPDSPENAVTAIATWPAVAQALDVPLRTQAYPQTTLCPVCRTGTLTVLYDKLREGHWHHCEGCGRNGDMVSLAAAAWGISRAAALLRLGASEPREVSYLTYGDDPWAQCAKLWAEVGANALQAPGPSATQLLTRFKLDHSLSPERAAAGPARLFGHCHHTTAAACFNPHTVDGAPSRGGSFRLFKGGNWGQVVAVPYFDLPGRVRSFLFIGRDGAPGDYVYRHHTDGANEFGLAGLDLLYREGERVGRTVVAMSDPLLMLQLQVRHLNSSTVPLPLVAWHDGIEGVTVNAWECLADRTIVFWSLGMSASTLRQAMLVDGHLCVLGPQDTDNQSVEHYLRHKSPQDQLKAVMKRARPWRETLRAWADRVGEEAFESLLAELDDTDVNTVLRYCDPRLADVVGRVRSRPLIRSVRLGTVTVTEHPDGSWYAVKYAAKRPPEPCGVIVDAALRIEQIVLSGATSRYKGYVRYRGEEVPFDALKSLVDKDPLKFVDRLLIEKRKGVLVFSRDWSGRLIALAQLFHTPLIVKG
jgi:hypothetical protein